MQIEPCVLTPQMLQHVLLPRDINAHKGVCGSAAVIGGSEGMVGAVLLAARAALYAGAGRVYAAMLSADAPVVDVSQPELMMRSPASLAQLQQLDSVAIGPGLGQTLQAIEMLVLWLTAPFAQRIPLILDADALNLIAVHAHLGELVKKRHTSAIITPHAGEAARLLKIGADAVQQSRTDVALALAQKFNVICVLKGAGTLCAYPDERLFVNPTGNPALAAAGTGDVLTGILAGLVAQGVSPAEAVQLGVFVHGLAADQLVARGVGPRGLTASEVLIEVRHTINQLSAGLVG